MTQVAGELHGSVLKTNTNFTRSLEMQDRFHELIPGGGHTYAKGDDQYPEFMPPYIERGLGSHVWDVDDNEYIEYGMGLRAVTLGHGEARVAEAAYRQMLLGNNFVRPAAIELEAAESFLQGVPAADMVKFAKNGSDATTAAVRLARAYTGRDLVAIAANQPFFSVDDWFIGTTPMNRGIPRAISDLTVTFLHDDLDSVEAVFTRNEGQVACLIMEAAKYAHPAPGFLEGVRELCDRHGVVFILDEMITGLRWHIGGAQAYYGVEPDLSAWGKSLGNGHAISALAGKKELMRLGGWRHDQERVFLLSTTHGAEGNALAAMLQVLRIYREEPIIATMEHQGTKLREGVEPLIAKHGLEDYFSVVGLPWAMVYWTRDPEGNHSQPYRTLFIQETMKRGLLAPSFIISAAHSDDDIAHTVHAVDGALEVYKAAIENGIDDYLVGRPVQPAVRPFA
jgi:glutamate-1-semialdehyde 2,1-aminomutase